MSFQPHKEMNTFILLGLTKSFLLVTLVSFRPPNLNFYWENQLHNPLQGHILCCGSHVRQ